MIIVLKMEPVWGTAQSVAALYGVPRRRLLSLAKAGTIRARKMSPDSRTSSTVFRMQDVRDWLEQDAPAPRARMFRRGLADKETGKTN